MAHSQAGADIFSFINSAIYFIYEKRSTQRGDIQHTALELSFIMFYIETSLNNSENEEILYSFMKGKHLSAIAWKNKFGLWKPFTV